MVNTDYAVHILTVGYFRLDGGAMFGVVPKVLWEKHKPADEKNRIYMATNVLLIQGGGRNILVDTGLGSKFDEKFQRIYAVEDAGDNLESALASHGLQPSDITHVIITHLHFDHAGGSTRRTNTGQIVPTFPNATYYIQRAQWEWALNPTERDRASYIKDDFVPLQQAGVVELLDGPGQLFPGIDVMVVNGHTVGQQLVRVHTSDRIWFFAGDLLPLSTHVPLPWIMAYDLHPLETLQEKKRILPQAVEEGWAVVFEHDREVPCARIERTEKGFAAGEILTGEDVK